MSWKRQIVFIKKRILLTGSQSVKKQPPDFAYN